MGVFGLHRAGVCPACQYDATAVVSRRWTIFLRIEARSQNRLQGKGAGARWVYTKHAKEVLALIQAIAPQLGISRAVAKRRVTVEREWGKRQRAFDRGNLIGGLKPVLDGLRDAGLLVDDSPKWVEDHYVQSGPHPTPGIRIVLEELG